jgi:hypothetical protein
MYEIARITFERTQGICRHFGVASLLTYRMLDAPLRWLHRHFGPFLLCCDVILFSAVFNGLTVFSTVKFGGLAWLLPAL